MQQISVASHHRTAHAISPGVFTEAFQGIQSLAKGACFDTHVLGYSLCVRKDKQRSAIFMRE